MPRYRGDGGGAEIQMTTKLVMHSVAHYLVDRNKKQMSRGDSSTHGTNVLFKNNIP